jgi:hypothetical protein
MHVNLLKKGHFILLATAQVGVLPWNKAINGQSSFTIFVLSSRRIWKGIGMHTLDVGRQIQERKRMKRKHDCDID